jgi:hypothetical protein
MDKNGNIEVEYTENVKTNMVELLKHDNSFNIKFDILLENVPTLNEETQNKLLDSIIKLGNGYTFRRMVTDYKIITEHKINDIACKAVKYDNLDITQYLYESHRYGSSIDWNSFDMFYVCTELFNQEKFDTLVYLYTNKLCKISLAEFFTCTSRYKVFKENNLMSLIKNEQIEDIILNIYLYNWGDSNIYKEMLKTIEPYFSNLSKKMKTQILNNFYNSSHIYSFSYDKIGKTYHVIDFMVSHGANIKRLNIVCCTYPELLEYVLEKGANVCYESDGINLKRFITNSTDPFLNDERKRELLEIIEKFND